MGSTEASSRFQIILKGEAEVSLPAERAVLRIEIETADEEKQEAAKETVATAKEVEKLLMQLAPQKDTQEARSQASIDHWTRTSMSEKKKGVNYNAKTHEYEDIEYTASITFEARFQKFHALSTLISSLTQYDNVETGSVTWILKEETKASYRAALRAQSATDAFQKAKEYATALGYERVVPYKLKESTAYEYGTRMKGGYAYSDGVSSTKKNLAEAGWEEVGVFQYQPEDIKISAAVEGEFYAE